MINKPVSSYAFLSILSVLVLCVSVFVNPNLHQANAQNATTVNFLTYNSPTLGFTIQHPSNWNVDETGVNPDNNMTFRVIRFHTQTEAQYHPIFVVSADNVSSYLDTNTLTLKDNTLQQSVQEKLDLLSSLVSNSPNSMHNIIRAKPQPADLRIG